MDENKEGTQNSNSRWNRLKKRAKTGYSSAKQKYQQYKLQNDLENIGDDNTAIKVGDLENHMQCSVCQSNIPKELIQSLKLGNSVICEKCGSQILGKNK